MLFRLKITNAEKTKATRSKSRSRTQYTYKLYQKTNRLKASPPKPSCSSSFKIWTEISLQKGEKFGHGNVITFWGIIQSDGRPLLVLRSNKLKVLVYRQIFKYEENNILKTLFFNKINLCINQTLSSFSSSKRSEKKLSGQQIVPICLQLKIYGQLQSNN